MIGTSAVGTYSQTHEESETQAVGQQRDISCLPFGTLTESSVVVTGMTLRVDGLRDSHLNRGSRKGIKIEAHSKGGDSRMLSIL